MWSSTIACSIVFPAAKEMIEYLMQRENVEERCTAVDGYDLPPFPKMLDFPTVVQESYSMTLARRSFLPMIVTRGSDQASISTSFQVRNEPSVVRNYGSLLTEFAKLRAVNLDLLSSWKLTPASLELPGLHPSLGPVTLRQLLASWVVHDLGHLAQIERVMAKQYRAEVGPWLPFSPILTDHEVPRS